MILLETYCPLCFERLTAPKALIPHSRSILAQSNLKLEERWCYRFETHLKLIHAAKQHPERWPAKIMLRIEKNNAKKLKVVFR